MNVRQAQRTKLSAEVRPMWDGIGIVCSLEKSKWCKSDSNLELAGGGTGRYSIGANRIDARSDYLKGEPRSVLDASAIFICSIVDIIMQKLTIHQSPSLVAGCTLVSIRLRRESQRHQNLLF